VLPFADDRFDGAIDTVSIQYLIRPLEVFAEVYRVLRPGGRFVLTFSNRCFPTKAVRIWSALGDKGHAQLVAAYFARSAPWSDVRALDCNPDRGDSDPLTMSLQEAIKATMSARGLKMPDLLACTPQRDRSTIYRLLNGDTRDAKIGTLLAICTALGLTPNDLLSLAGLWPDSRSNDQLDMRLRRVFVMVQSLATPYKVVAVTQVERLVDTWQEAADGLLSVDDDSAG
jgi:SAM-dependent methyltransferase